MTEGRKIYIKTATQISMQQPLSEAWLTEPLLLTEPYVRSLDPNFRDWLNPLESRRMGKLMKRAIVTATKAMKEADVAMPDAIITGTGLGCIEHTERFLEQICREGEEMLKPTNFMQSTHNTIGSLVAIQTKCHGYNTTYSHRGVSFDSALADAFMQLSMGDISTALVMGHDEMTPSYFTILKRMGYVGQPGQVPGAEASVAMVLTTGPSDDALCEVAAVERMYGLTHLKTLPRDIDAVVVGTNGCAAHDAVYEEICQQLPAVPRLHYKHLFGECYSASALGLYAAAHVLQRGGAPAIMRCDGGADDLKVNSLLFVNHSDGRNVAYVVLRRFIV
ncbi:MAG: beta-ketoacyl synthase chain length factor [Prevotella sp.]|nr:beta-ketoacyl synthase chain length factor [Prevotella sp.]